MFPVTSAYYGAFEVNLMSNYKPTYGLKIGGEVSFISMLFGIESKIQTDFRKQAFVLTPKIGIGDGIFLSSFQNKVYLFYGYNISISEKIERLLRINVLIKQ